MSPDEARRSSEQSLSNLHFPLDKVSTSSVNVLTILVGLSERDSATDALKVRDSINEIVRNLSTRWISWSDTLIGVYTLNQGVLRKFVFAEDFVPLTESEMTYKVDQSPLPYAIALCADNCTRRRNELESVGYGVRSSLLCFAVGRPHDPRFDEFFGRTYLSNVCERVRCFLPEIGRNLLAGVGIGEHAAAEFGRYGFPADTIHPIADATQAALGILEDYD